MISTKGRYALRVMIDLAEQPAERPVPLKEIAERQGISKKYLEIIMKDLVDGKLVKGSSGKGGIFRRRDRGTDGGHAGTRGLSAGRGGSLPALRRLRDDRTVVGAGQSGP